MSSIAGIVDVSITNETTSITRAGFGVPAILGWHDKWPERYRSYTKLGDLVNDGFSDSDAVYRAAQAVFSQNPRPTKVIVGRRDSKPTWATRLTPTITTEGHQYRIAIGDDIVTYSVPAAATLATIATALAAAVTGLAAGITATAAGNDVVLGAPAGDLPAVEFGAGLNVLDTTADVGIAADLAALWDANKEWYGLLLTARGAAELAAAATWVLAQRRLMIAATADTGPRTTGITDDIGSTLRATSNDRVAIMYHHAPYEFPEAAWLGKMFPMAPGSATWAYKTLAGVSVTPTAHLNDTHIGELEDRRVNYYHEVAGIGITRTGQVASGEWIDVRQGIDWLHAQISESIFSALTRLRKIPYTDAGIAVIRSILEARLQDGVNVGLLVPDSIDVRVPLAADVSTLDRGDRVLLNDVEFSARLQGALHAIAIQGVVSV